MTSIAAALLQDRLGLSDEELLTVLDASPLAVVGGELEHRAELPLLLALTEEPAERLGPGVLGRWLRSTGPAGRPLDHLLARDFGAFEDDLDLLAERGFVLRGGG
jgi:hypothetical protein